MTLRAFIVVMAIALFFATACRHQSDQPRVSASPQARADSTALARPPVEPFDPESVIDRSIREALNAVIEQDPDLKDRRISFRVDNGEVTATGLVQTEGERTKVNGLAMRVAGVNSVANAVRVTPD